MTEQELRTLVREAIARHAGPGAGGRSLQPGAPVAQVRTHASHALFTLPAGADGDGPCLIEPAVACNHCGYCKSYGH
jgi:hypothetical protein